MPRVDSITVLLKNLSGEIKETSRLYVPEETVYEELKRRSGQDFGYDVNMWRDYIKMHPEIRTSPPIPSAGMTD
jgi:hypothetical protein